MAESARDRAPAALATWWRTGLLYQIYVRSFADSNGDGVGDLRGVIDRLDHLSWLGVDGIWLSPITPSPNADWGYDVADYCAIDPDYGTLADLDELVATANAAGHPGPDRPGSQPYERSASLVRRIRSSKDAAYRDFYVWVDPKPDGSPPNNWVGCFGGPAWTLDETTGQYYLHNFLPEQPDLNWWSEDVRNAFDDILRFWWDRGVAGFRIDVCNMIVKDAAAPGQPAGHRRRPLHHADVRAAPGVHEQPARGPRRPASLARMADGYDPARVLLGETNVEALETLATFYGDGHDELSLGFNFPFIEAPFEADALRAVVERTEALLPAGVWPVWTGSNHDVSRLATRWAGGHPDKVRVALLMLLTLRGTPSSTRATRSV